jgi:SPP1 gp7 family putative phage head morphogenesis protein
MNRQQYNAKLQLIVRQVKRDIDAALLPVIKAHAPEYVADSAVATADGWSDAIQSVLSYLSARWSSPRAQSVAEQIANSFVTTALKKSERDMKRSVGIDVFSGNAKMREYLKASAMQNASLIKSIPEQYLDQVGTLVMSNMRAGMRPGNIAELLQDQYGVTQRRAKFIARDQAGKIQGDLAEKQQRGAGFEYFQWLDSDDSRVRDWHSKIANKLTAYGRGVYRWDDLPLSEKGVPIKPGQDYGCRCTSKPISARKVEENQRKGLVAKGVYR